MPGVTQERKKSRGDLLGDRGKIAGDHTRNTNSDGEKRATLSGTDSRGNLACSDGIQTASRCKSASVASRRAKTAGGTPQESARPASREEEKIISFTLSEAQEIMKNARRKAGCVPETTERLPFLKSQSPKCTYRSKRQELARTAYGVEKELRALFLPKQSSMSPRGVKVRFPKLTIKNLQSVSFIDDTRKMLTKVHRHHHNVVCDKRKDLSFTRGESVDIVDSKRKDLTICPRDRIDILDDTRKKLQITQRDDAKIDILDDRRRNLEVIANDSIDIAPQTHSGPIPALDVIFDLQSNTCYATFSLSRMKEYTQEYGDTKRKFLSSLGPSIARGIKVIEICRVVHSYLYKRYKLKKEQMEEMKDHDRNLEQQLWHGTTDDVVQSINQKGFITNFVGKNAAVYGNGIYFARNADYSHKYARPNKKGERFMYLARVLTGDYTQGQHGMRLPPNKPNATPYDSVVNIMPDPIMFIVFDQDQVYPEYLIKYK